MLVNVRSFYARSNAYELAFATLVTGLACFIAVFSVLAQITLYYGYLTGTPAVLFVFVICTLIMALIFRGKAFVVPTIAKVGLLAVSIISLLAYHVIV